MPPPRPLFFHYFFFLSFFLFSSLESRAANPRIDLGIDVLAGNNFRGLEGKRIGLITNPTGVNKWGESTIDILRRSKKVKLVALYGPEHGLDGKTPAGDYVKHKKDARTGLPVYSLYGPTRKPTPEMLKGIDILMFDVQDIGTRSYTYISTMGLAMEAAGEAGIPFFVLDRPNPMGGTRVEGMPLDDRWRSFVGRWDIPYVHGLTVGELARMIKAKRWISPTPRLMVVPMRGWRRNMLWKETGLEWIASSPYIPKAESPFFYAMTGVVGSFVHHGIGTSHPFEYFTGTTFKSKNIASLLNSRRLPGVYFRPASFKQRKRTFRGVKIEIKDINKINLMEVAANLLDVIAIKKGPSIFKEKRKNQFNLLDKVCGGQAIRHHFSKGRSPKTLVLSWQHFLRKFRAQRKKYLLYP